MIKEFLQNSFIFTIGTIFTRGINIILIPLYTRYLSPADYGVIDLFVIITSFVAIVFTLEINQAVVRFYQDTVSVKKKIEYVSTAYYFIFIAYCIFFLISFIFSNQLTIFFLDSLDYYNIYLLATTTVVTAGIFYFTQGQLRWQIMPKQYVYVSIINIVVIACLSVYLLVAQSMGIEGVFIGQIVGNMIGIAISFYFTRKSYQLVFNPRRLSKMLSFSYPLIFSGIAVFVTLYIDRILIKEYMSLSDLGVYGVAYRFATISGLVMAGFQSSLTPLIYKHYKNQQTPMQISQLFNIFVVFALFVSMGAILFSKELIVVFTTENFYSASSLIPILVISVFFANMYIFVPGLSLANKTKYIALISVFNAISNIVIILCLMPIFGLIGAAAASMISAILTFVLYVKLSNKYYFVSYEWRKAGFASTVLFFIVPIIFFLPDINMLNFFIKFLLMIIISFGIIRIYFDFTMISNFLNKILIKRGLK